MHNYEIEIKSLLKNKDHTTALIEKMRTTDSNFKIIGTHSQLNHYFIAGDLKTLFENISTYLTEDKKKLLLDLSTRAKDFSVRTRQADLKILLVVKATVDDTTSSNGTARLEFEAEFSNLNLGQLDKILIDAGFKYQAKWSRDRQEFNYLDLSVSIDKNAGYGYLAEFEKVIDNQEKAGETKTLIRKIMNDLGVEELPQDRLERMFKFYNEHWNEYYGTEKTFNIE